MSSIELSHVGPIEKLTIPCPEDGGVVVLRGRNGSGKSHALEGVESLYSKSSRSGLRNSDGVPSGSIEGMGVTVRLGRVNTAKGELVCESLDGRVDPSQLVDPGIKDPQKADAKRLVSLIRLGNVKVPAEKWAASLKEAADKVAVMDLVDEDPVVTADRIRRRLHEVAREQEKLADSEAAESASIAKLIEDTDLSSPHDEDELAGYLDSATSALAKAESKRDSYARAKVGIVEAEEKLAGMVAVDLKPLRESLEKAKSEMETAENAVADIQAAIKKLHEQLTAASISRGSAEAGLLQAAKAVESAEKENEKRSVFLEAAAVTLPEMVSESTVEKLKVAKHDALKAVQYGQTVRQAIATKAKSDALAKSAEAKQKSGEKYRSLAKSTDAVLEQALVDAGYNKIKIHDGRLCVESDRMQLEPFSDLSHGERWSMALDMAAAGLPKGSVLPVAQEAFEALDPDNRNRLNELAKERGLVIVTAEATEGELRAEVLS